MFALVAEWKSGGLTKKAFLGDKPIGLSKFNYWCNKCYGQHQDDYYIGKAKNGIQKRYSLRKLTDFQIEAIDQLQKVPDDVTALGVEQLVMELNGWASKVSNKIYPILSNKINTTVNPIYKARANKWLNENFDDRETLFKFE